MIYLNVLFIAIICVIVTDCTDFWLYVKKTIWKIAYGNKKTFKDFPFKLLDCSLCQTWWMSLIYLLFATKLTLWLVTYSLLMAFMTPVIYLIISLLKDLGVGCVGFLYKIFGID